MPYRELRPGSGGWSLRSMQVEETVVQNKRGKFGLRWIMTVVSHRDLMVIRISGACIQTGNGLRA